MDETTRQLYVLKANLMRALAHPLRLAILDCLRKGEQYVCNIAECIGASRSNVSRHLALLMRTGMLTCRKDGLNVFYSLRTPCVLNFFGCAEGVLREQLKAESNLLKRMGR